MSAECANEIRSRPLLCWTHVIDAGSGLHAVGVVDVLEDVDVVGGDEHKALFAEFFETGEELALQDAHSLAGDDALELHGGIGAAKKCGDSSRHLKPPCISHCF